MVRELCSGGVIQYPTAANLQSTGQNHAYQNTGTTFKAECECVPQISGMPARHSAPCVSGTLSSIDTGHALGPSVGLQHQLAQAKLQQEMMKSQSQAVRLQPQVPTQLVT